MIGSSVRSLASFVDATSRSLAARSRGPRTIRRFIVIAFSGPPRPKGIALPTVAESGQPLGHLPLVGFDLGGLEVPANRRRGVHVCPQKRMRLAK